MPGTQSRVSGDSWVCGDERSYGWQVTREPSVRTESFVEHFIEHFSSHNWSARQVLSPPPPIT